MVSILVVCTANICRSPMAEGLLVHAAAQRRIVEPVSVHSAGVAAATGRPVSEGSVAALARMGIDISGHLASALDEAAVEAADLILTMESAHVVEIVAKHPSVRSRTFTLREVVDLGGAATLPEPEPLPLFDRDGADRRGVDPAPGSASELLRSWAERVDAHRSTRDHLGRRDLDIEDPIGQSRAKYRQCAAVLEGLCESLAEMLWGPVTTSDRQRSG